MIVRPGLLYGGDNRLIREFFVEPGAAVGAVAYIGGGANHWALVYLDDLAELYVAARAGRPGSVYLGVGGVDPTARLVAEAAALGAELEGKTVSITLEQARADMGPIAEAFALDQLCLRGEVRLSPHFLGRAGPGESWSPSPCRSVLVSGWWWRGEQQL